MALWCTLYIRLGRNTAVNYKCCETKERKIGKESTSAGWDETRVCRSS